ncbi:MAG: hypothetical protein H7145_03530 [Akkermansiaceae bacterium]|nr:hypothetical protein [Armatimonadota bacterium]
MTDIRFSPDRPVSGWAFLLAVIALIGANIPYLLGLLWTPEGATFTGLTFNADDGAVYLAWIRQASEGNFFFTNRFTTEPQQGLLVNLFFYLLGTVGRITQLAPPVIYAVARVVFGGLLLWALWRLVVTVLAESRARILAFAFLCFASGFGFSSDFDPRFAFEQPIDRWQPEAITFLSLYYTPLFTSALALMAVFAASFYRAEQTGRKRDLIPACLAGFLLGNFHSYDILQLFAFAGVYRVLTDVLNARANFAGYVRLAIIGLAMLPTAGYQFWAIQNEAVFNARVFATATETPSLVWVLLGFGLPLLLTVIAPFVDPARRKFSPDAMRLLIVWAVVAVAIAYVPVSFQRKLLMGAHLPLCIVAGATLAAVTEKLSGSLPAIISVFAVLITVPSNVRLLARDTALLARNAAGTQYRPYLLADEADALRFLENTAKPGDAVLVPPDMVSYKYGATPLLPYLGVYVPAYSSATAYAAHWSETALFQERKLGEQTNFFRAAMTDGVRQAFLDENPTIRYVLYADAVKNGLVDAQGKLFANEKTGAPLFAGVDWTGGSDNVPPFLEPVHQSGSVTIFRVKRDGE